jgi:outer membrane protein insertion porin family
VTNRLGPVGVVVAALVLVPGIARGQRTAAAAADTIVVQGNRRVSAIEVLGNSGLTPGRPVSYRELQRSIQALYNTGQFEDIQVLEDVVDGRTRLIIKVRERPLLLKWTLRGLEHLTESKLKEDITIVEARPLDPALVANSIANIDSTYKAAGYYLARTKAVYAWEPDSTAVRIVLDVSEGERVAIAQVQVDGNSRFSDEDIVKHIKTQPEGFLWFQKGEFNDDNLAEDLRERLPTMYGRQGYADFQVLTDTVIVNDTTGKAMLQLRVSEGPAYQVGTFEVLGNRRFSTEQIEAFYPFIQLGRYGFLGLGGQRPTTYFDKQAWENATASVQQAYYNEGYVYVNVRPDVMRRVDTQGRSVVDLRWVINEGRPAIVNRVEIRGNDVTYERVIREAIVIVPGDVFRQNALIQSYQNISNLGFFQQPLPPPETRPNEEGDLDIIFQVTEKRTGNVNFGATIGQGTGLGGFIGLDEANLFGQGKRGRFQWQFGQNINDFEVQYSDPALLQSRVSGTVTLYNRRVRYQIADLGRLKRVGGSLQFGFPLLGDRYTRLFVSYALDQQSFIGSATNIAFTSKFVCQECVRSTISTSVLRDRRIDLPFATAGSMGQVTLSQSGGPLGGTGNFQKIDFEGKWFAPLGEIGRGGAGAARKNPIKLTLGMSSKMGFVFGDSPFFEQMFSMGGTQFGIPLRGYEEFSITPKGYDPLADTRGASPDAVGKAFFALTSEFGVRVSQGLYGSFFLDVGNVWADAQHFNPSRLFRGAGFGISFQSPLGPLGLDYAYGFDRTDVLGRRDPGWKFHFRLGQPF